MVSDAINVLLKAHDKNFTGVEWAYFVSGPGNWIVFFWTIGSCYVACVGDEGEAKRRVLWCNPA